MNAELSVVLLCYRAGERIRAFVERIVELLDSAVGSWEMVLVGNYIEGSDDDTPKVVREVASKRNNIRAVTLPKRGMMGWDARGGLSKATGRFICLIDGDEQMPPEDIVKVYKKIKDEGLDFVKTYRIKRYDGALRRANSYIYNLLFKMLFPRTHVRDVNSKPKIFTREAYSKMNLVSDDWFLDAEMVLQSRKLKFKVGEVPTVFYNCGYRRSFIKLDAVFEFIRNMFYARLKGFFK